MIKIAISAAESSGDLLAAELIKLFDKDKLIFFGLAGDKMQQSGCKKYWDVKEVSVMGYTEVLKKIFSILRLRKEIIKTIILNEPKLFIGVDSPDFNLGIEKKLKQQGIKTVHFISPSLWAWRASRVKKIKKYTDLVLCLFPFEVDFYKKHGITAKFVGHPLTKVLKPRTNYKPSNNVLLMPGSRESEIKQMIPIILAAAKLMQDARPELVFNMALLDDKLLQWVKQQITISGVSTKVLLQKSHEQLRDSDLVIVASGTATLEALMVCVPMVVIYKLSTITYTIAKTLTTIKYLSLPNILANKQLVPELIQKNANKENIKKHALELLAKDNTELISQFHSIYNKLDKNSDKLIKDAITELL